jgi:hypothetical protein
MKFKTKKKLMQKSQEQKLEIKRMRNKNKIPITKRVKL